MFDDDSDGFNEIDRQYANRWLLGAATVRRHRRLREAIHNLGCADPTALSQVLGLPVEVVTADLEFLGDRPPRRRRTTKPYVRAKGEGRVQAERGSRATGTQRTGTSRQQSHSESATNSQSDQPKEQKSHSRERVIVGTNGSTRNWLLDDENNKPTKRRTTDDQVHRKERFAFRQIRADGLLKDIMPQAARYLSMSRVWVYRHLDVLPHVRLGDGRKPRVRFGVVTWIHRSPSAGSFQKAME